MKISHQPIWFIAVIALASNALLADVPLIGFNPPGDSLLDGDFDNVTSKRWNHFPSPDWTTRVIDGRRSVGIDTGRMSGGGNTTVEINSPVLNHDPQWKAPREGDVLRWRFAAKAEFVCDSSASFAFVFGDHVRAVADRKPLPCNAAEPAVFEGRFEVTEADAAAGLPSVSVTLRSSDEVSVFLDYVDVSILDSDSSGPAELTASVGEEGVTLRWPVDDVYDSNFNVYRSRQPRSGYEKIASGVEGQSVNSDRSNESPVPSVQTPSPQRSPKGRASKTFVDASIVDGMTYYYLVKRRIGDRESSASPVVTARRLDATVPPPPNNLTATPLDAEVRLAWQTDAPDVSHYRVFRGDANGQNMRLISHDCTKTHFIDFSPEKGVANSYAVLAVDRSGNEGERSAVATATVGAVPGASFRDLILPMPVGNGLRDDVWGANNVLPRNPEIGIEHPNWSYWGGHPWRWTDGKYHMLVCRWPEGAVKGHWDWPNSTVVHTTSDSPTGPYVPTGETAYQWNGGRGHNPGLTRLTNGTFMLHLLEGHVLTGPSPAGPWKYEGVIKVDYNGHENDERHNERQYIANLAGLQRDDGSLIFISKWGATMISRDGILGPYVVQNQPVIHTEAVPPLYRNVGYEDPAFWRDEYQYHMIINGFIARRAIYLRSPDGIHWKFDPGTAYDPFVTRYEDGTIEHWDILERPHVLQGQYGRATHFSLAVSDVYKYDDYARDGHSTKNIMLPLIVHQRLKMLNAEPITASTERIRVLVLSEDGFDASSAMDLESLRFGASEEVNFGRGSRVVDTEEHPEGLVLVFDGRDNGLNPSNFVGKMIGRRKDSSLLVGFSDLP